MFRHKIICQPNIFIRTRALGYRCCHCLSNISIYSVDFRWQPFLTPIPPLGSQLILAKVLLPLRYILATVRTLLVLLLALIYVVLVRGVCLILVKLPISSSFYHLLIYITSKLPIPPVYRLVEHLFTYIIGRSALFILGLLWISVEQVTRKRGSANEI